MALGLVAFDLSAGQDRRSGNACQNMPRWYELQKALSEVGNRNTTSVLNIGFDIPDCRSSSPTSQPR